MAIRRKNRRKIVVDNRRFVWWVCDGETDWGYGPTLTIASEDKRFVVCRFLTYTLEPVYLVVMGPEFPGLDSGDGGWRRVQCPVWEDTPMITPGQVRRLIEWCLSGEVPLVEVNRLGIPTS
jgi:hypothetical protein